MVRVRTPRRGLSSQRLSVRRPNPLAEPRSAPSRIAATNVAAARSSRTRSHRASSRSRVDHDFRIPKDAQHHRQERVPQGMDVDDVGEARLGAYIACERQQPQRKRPVRPRQLRAFSAPHARRRRRPAPHAPRATRRAGPGSGARSIPVALNRHRLRSSIRATYAPYRECLRRSCVVASVPEQALQPPVLRKTWPMPSLVGSTGCDWAVTRRLGTCPMRDALLPHWTNRSQTAVVGQPATRGLAPGRRR